MEVNTTLWGTIPAPDVAEPLKILNEQEMEVVMNAMETEPHEPEVEDEKKNLEAEYDTLKLVPAECSQMSPIILNTLELVQYAKRISELTDRICTQNRDVTAEIQNLSPIPSLLKTKSEHLHRPPDDDSDFVMGIGSLPFSLNCQTRHQILYKSVATLAAHKGYDFSSSPTLEVLTSATSDLITKICRLFRLTVDKTSSSSSSIDYLQCLERVFHEMNLGTLRSLHYYYRTQVLDYQRRMRFQCEKLVEELHIANEAVIVNLLKQGQISNGQNFEMDFKPDDDDIPLLHFPASEDGTENDGFQSSLEHGFQMLHNLEQEQKNEGHAKNQVPSMLKKSFWKLFFSPPKENSLDGHFQSFLAPINPLVDTKVFAPSTTCTSGTMAVKFAEFIMFLPLFFLLADLLATAITNNEGVGKLISASTGGDQRLQKLNGTCIEIKSFCNLVAISNRTTDCNWEMLTMKRI